MKKRGVTLLILTLTLGLLIGGYYLVGALTKKEPVKDTSPLLSVTQDSLRRISVTYSGDSISLLRDKDGWGLENEPSFPLDQGQVKVMAGALQNLTPKSEIPNPAALADYGLDHPQIEIALSDGDTDAVLKVGDYNELISGYYLLYNDHVYTVDSSVKTAFSKALCDLAIKEEIPVFDRINAVTVSNSGTKTVLRYDEDGRDTAYSGAFQWFLDSAEGAPPLDPQRMQSYLAKLEVVWQKCAAWNATDEQLRSFGLEDGVPSVSVDYTDTETVDTGTKDANGNPVKQTVETGKVFRLLFGAETEGGRYARISGSRMVYVLAAADCEELLRADYDSLKPASLLTLDWDDISAVDLQMDGQLVTVVRNGDSWGFRGTPLSEELAGRLQSALNSLSLGEDAGETADASIIKGTIYQNRKGFEQLSFTLTPSAGSWSGTFMTMQAAVSADAAQALRDAVNAVVSSVPSEAPKSSGG